MSKPRSSLLLEAVRHQLISFLGISVLIAGLVVVIPSPRPVSAAPGAAEWQKEAGSLAPSRDLDRSRPVGAEGISDKAADAGLAFVENHGQLDPRVRYYIQGAEASVYFTDRGVRMSLSGAGMSDPADNAGDKRWVIDHAFLGADAVRPIATRRSQMTVSYFKGDRADWHTGLPTFERITYRDVWPGVDLVYWGTGQGLKYDVIVHPGADPEAIALSYRHARRVQQTAMGTLEVRTPIGSFTEEAPIAYQRRGGARVEVPASFEIAQRGYGFELGAFDASRTLVIDPEVVIYAGYIGGSGSDTGNAVAVDSSGNAYVTGSTDSTEATFPENAGPGLAYSGAGDAFVAKVSADGSGLVYAGYLGGSAYDVGTAIAVDSSGNAYVTGETASSDGTFPVSGGPDVTHNGASDAFVAKVTTDGTGLVYAGYIGGSGAETGTGIAVDSSGNAYVTGSTDSTATTFPETVGPGLIYNGGSYDAFVAKVLADGSALTYAGYIGGSGRDVPSGIAVDSSGNAYVLGTTDSTEADFPGIAGPDLTSNGFTDAFVAKVLADGTGLSYSGYIGGSGFDSGRGIAVDSGGNAYVTGSTASDATTFPETVGPDLSYNGGTDAFVAKVAPDGSTLTYAGYIGGSASENGTGIAVDSGGNAYVTGFTASTETTFPETDGPDLSFNGGADAFVVKVAAAGTELTYAGYLGGSGTDVGNGIAVDSFGNAYVTGSTDSDATTFPEIGGPDTSYNLGNDAFVAKVGVTFDLTVTNTGTGAGTVTSAPAGISCMGDCSESYSNGTSVILTATADPGSTFSGWTGDCSGTSTCTLTMSAAKAATATFVPTFALTVTNAGTGTGTVTSAPAGIDCGVDCDETYVDGTSVTLTATAGSGSEFSGWSQNCSGSSTCTLTINGARAATATFNLRPPPPPPDPQRSLTVSTVGTGSGTVTSSPNGIDCGSDCSQTYASGTSVTLTAAADPGSTFSGWSEDCSGAGTCVLAMSADRRATATFVPLPPSSFVLTHTNMGMGSGTVTSSSTGIDCGADCSETYGDGTTVVLTAAPAAGSSFDSWSGCDSVVDRQCTVAMSADRDVTASFDVLTVTCRGETATIQVTAPDQDTYGTMEADVIVGTAGDDVIYGLNHADIICGMGGDDELYGGQGKDGGRWGDSLYGGPGNDLLAGDGGDDILRGGSGKDRIFGNEGNDTLFGNRGADRLVGNDGRDTCNGGRGRRDTARLCEISRFVP